MHTTFDTIISGFGNNAGIEVPPDKIAELGSSHKPPVVVTVNGYTYKSTIAVMGGKYLISLSKAHRDASGLNAGHSATVTLELDEGPREAEVPVALQAALDANGMAEVFAKLSYSKRKEYCRQISEAKTDETRDRRIALIIGTIK